MADIEQLNLKDAPQQFKEDLKKSTIENLEQQKKKDRPSSHQAYDIVIRDVENGSTEYSDPALVRDDGAPGCHACNDVVHPLPGYENKEFVVGVCDRGVVNYWKQRIKPKPKPPTLKEEIVLDKNGLPTMIIKAENEDAEANNR